MTTERILGPPMRMLLGLLGVIAFGTSVMIGMTELRLMRAGAPAVPALLVAAFCVLVAVGGGALMRGAVRGRIAVRRPGHRAPIM